MEINNLNIDTDEVDVDHAETFSDDEVNFDKNDSHLSK